MRVPRIINALGGSLGLMRTRWGFSLIALAADFLFLLLFFQTHYIFFTRASSAVMTLMQGLQEQASSISAETLTDINTALLSTPERQAAWASLLENITIFLLITCALWLALKGIAWLCAHRIAGNKSPLAQFAGTFALSSIAGFALWLLALLLGAAMIESATSSPLPLFGESAARSIILLLLALILYALWAAYARGGSATQSFKAAREAFTRWRAFLPAAATAALLGAAGIINTASLVQMSKAGGLAFLILIALPLLTLGRVVMVRALTTRRT